MTAVSAVIFAVLLVHANRTLAAGGWEATGRLLVACIAAAVLYIIAHLMRAFRLAVIAMPLLGASFRTVVLLHLFVAPWSLILPLKTDELIRLGELARTAKSWSRPIIVLLIDRSMDGVVLIGMALLLLAEGGWNVAAPVAVLGTCLSLLVLAFFLLPVLLEQVQRHIFVNHYQDRALHVLALVSKARGMLDISRRTISAAPAFLILATLGIWSMELVAIAAILMAIDPGMLSLHGVVEVTLGRADASWRIMLLGEQPSPAITLATFVFFDALLLVWLWVPLPYGKRQAGEPQRVRLPAAAGIVLTGPGKV
ncbi:hypothetical protein [Croceibacterium mercuriale]|uniref:hypothetical protein n=1 Tax=Croceibacterium mercuriale TaxID=1572751 RepID=UPI00126A6707|nr:hypothetical protein [Croceibacterium mercuriale]